MSNGVANPVTPEDKLPSLAQFNWPLTVIEWTLILMRCLHFNNVNRFGIPKVTYFFS